MRIAIVVLLVGLADVAVAARRATRVEDETPRATDLLRAERKAEEVRRRLELPAGPRRGGWRTGGDGWDRPRAVAPSRR